MFTILQATSKLNCILPMLQVPGGIIRGRAELTSGSLSGKPWNGTKAVPYDCFPGNHPAWSAGAVPPALRNRKAALPCPLSQQS